MYSQPDSPTPLKARWIEKQDLSASELRKKQEEEVKKKLSARGSNVSAIAVPTTVSAIAPPTIVEDVEKANIFEQYEALKQKLAVYESTQTTLSKEDKEEKEKARSIFEAFDTDKSGAIDWKEFQAVAFKLGQVLSEEEAKESIKEIDTDGNGGIDFEEFYAWWSSPFKNLDASNKKNIHLLKLQLQSKAFASGFSNFTSKLAAATTAVEKSADNKVDSTNKEEVSKLDLKVSVGQFKEARSSLSFNYKVDPAEAERQRKVANAKSDNAIVSISFEVKDKVDPFALGELSGNVKTILALASKKMATVVESFEAKIEKDGSTVIYRIYFVVKNIKNMLDIVKSVHIEELHGKVELSEKPGDPASGYFKARAELSAVAKRSDYKTIVNTLTEPKTTGYVTRAKKKRLAQYRACLAVRNLTQNIEVEGLPEIFKLLNLKAPPKQLHQGFASLLLSYTKPIAKVLLDEKVPDIGRETYSNSILLLAGIHSASVVVGDAVLSANFKGINVFEGYLPTTQQLQLLKGKSKQFEEDQIKFEHKKGTSLKFHLNHFDSVLKAPEGATDTFGGITHLKGNSKVVQFISYSEKIVALWTFNDGKFTSKLFLNPTTKPVVNVAFRKDGVFAVCAGNHIMISTINTQSNLLISFKILQHGEADNAVLKFYFSKIQNLGLSIGTNDEVIIWNLKAGTQLGCRRFDQPIRAFTRCKDFYFFTDSYTDSNLTAWELTDDKGKDNFTLKATLKLKNPESVVCIMADKYIKEYTVLVIHCDNTTSVATITASSDEFEVTEVSKNKFTEGKPTCFLEYSFASNLKFCFFDEVKNEKGLYQATAWWLDDGKLYEDDLSNYSSEQEEEFEKGYCSFPVYHAKLWSPTSDVSAFLKASRSGELYVIIRMA